MSELESQDVSFLKNEFLNIGEVDKDSQLYEIEDSNDIITSNDGAVVSTDPLGITTLSGSKTRDTSIPVGGINSKK